VRVGTMNKKNGGVRSRTGNERRTPTPRPGGSATGETLVETPDTASNKRKNLEEELQRPAFLRFKSNRLRS